MLTLIFLILMYNENMILITGLGNPEKKYINTPHNVGFKVIDLLREKLNFPQFTTDNNVLISKQNDIILIKPLTYMNNSGIGVKQVASYYKIESEHIWVVHDENNLRLGEIEINKNITAKGHNGIKSIIEKLETQDFVRFRLGVNNEKEHCLTDYVLKPFSKDEQEIIDEAVYKIVEILDEAIENSIEQVILKYKP